MSETAKLRPPVSESEQLQRQAVLDKLHGRSYIPQKLASTSIRRCLIDDCDRTDRSTPSPEVADVAQCKAKASSTGNAAATTR